MDSARVVGSFTVVVDSQIAGFAIRSAPADERLFRVFGNGLRFAGDAAEGLEVVWGSYFLSAWETSLSSGYRRTQLR